MCWENSDDRVSHLNSALETIDEWYKNETENSKNLTYDGESTRIILGIFHK